MSEGRRHRDDHRMYGTLSPWKLLLRCAVPGTLSMMVWMICTMADAIFVGNALDSTALAAMNIAWPVITIVTSLSDMVAVGSSVRISLCLGSGDEYGARVIFTNSLIMIVILSLMFMAIGLAFPHELLGIMGAEGELLDLAVEYMMVFAVAAPLVLPFFATDNYLRICGRMNFSMYINMGVALSNIVLDAIFLLLLGWGLWSAALASASTMCIGSVIALYPFFKRKLVLYFEKGKVGRKDLFNIMYNGSSSFLSSISGSVFAIFANTVVLSLAGVPAVSALGIVTYAGSIAMYLFFGIASSMQPALGYNHGSGDGVRMGSILRVTMMVLCISSIAVVSLMYVFSYDIVSIFLKDDEVDVLALAYHGLSIVVFSYLFSWVMSIVDMFLTSVDRPGHSLILGLLSKMIFPIVMMALLSSSMGMEGVWISFVAVEVLTAIVSLPFLLKARRDGLFQMHEPIPGFMG